MCTLEFVLSECGLCGVDFPQQKYVIQLSERELLGAESV